jgi:hypothetical protein
MGINFFSRLGPVCFSDPTAFSLHQRLLPGPGIYTILVSDASYAPRRFRPIYFGETEDFSRRVTTSHERYSDWTSEAGTADLYVAQSWMYSSTKQSRAVLEQALRDCYRPLCNTPGYSLSSTLAENLLRSGVQQPPASFHGLIAGLMSPPLSLFIGHANTKSR